MTNRILRSALDRFRDFARSAPGDRRRREFRRRFVVVSTVSILLAASSAASHAQKRIDKSFEVEPNGQLVLNLEGVTGSIEIRGQDGSETVKIAGSISGPDWTDENRLDMALRSGSLQVTPLYGRDPGAGDLRVRSILRIDVPRQHTVVVRSAARTVVQGIDGQLRVSVTRENLSLKDVHGRVDLVTSSGDLNIADSVLDGSVSATGGSVTFRRSTMTGTVTTVEGTATIDQARGKLEVSTTRGNLWIKLATGQVLAKTFGGSVEIEQLDGSLKAQVVDGNVTASLLAGTAEDVDRGIDLQIREGHALLYMPKAFSADFDLGLLKKDGDRRLRRFEIFSEYSLDMREEGFGKNGYRIAAWGRLNRGDHPVKIRTEFGNVTIATRR